ncbi:SDR family NAD(P)-dependent oxidoreductase [Pantoea sp. 1.19]|uniref:SDR family NAD(P)-dependent oxidoreductase n=1 Tax=Pantoea sp. 1.19 TaxID=1925589 RepID=UPI0009490F8C|nr:SDR family NAD(P)-dependent oxidoreductase [Pantoea sp. 1.19]
MQRLTGRTALITGAGSGIGQATVKRFLQEGARVVAVDVSTAGLQETRLQAQQAGIDARLTLLEVDIAQEAAVREQIGAAIAATGELDILVNAAGILRASHTHLTTLEFWNTLLAVNLTGTFLVTRTALPALLASGRGVVVNFSSTSASFAHPYMAAYAASKGGIQAFTHAIAGEYARQGLRALAVAPGSIASGMTRDPGLPADADMSLFAKLVPALGQGMGSPDCVAAVVALFASDDGLFITGTELRIDGGTHM